MLDISVNLALLKVNSSSFHLRRDHGDLSYLSKNSKDHIIVFTENCGDIFNHLWEIYWWTLLFAKTDFSGWYHQKPQTALHIIHNIINMIGYAIKNN